MRDGSKIVPPPISVSKTLDTRFELRSCSTMRSTLATTTSPGPTSFLALAFARIFSIMFIEGALHGAYRHRTGVHLHDALLHAPRRPMAGRAQRNLHMDKAR